MSISDNIKKIKSQLPDNVELVCVSKFHPVSSIREAYDAGQRIFGESKVQELVQKHSELPNDISWHFIGHLQTNKVKSLLPYVSLIHGVDSLKLLLKIEKEAGNLNIDIACLLQIHIAQEETKFGFTEEEILELSGADVFNQLNHVRICGLMGMATNTDDQNQIRSEFRRLKQLFDGLKTKEFSNKTYFKDVSMGMSDDYKIAIEEGSTLIRIGSAIFGSRIY
jgi:pyridoxal phosphate enzyme (YggS family)